MNQLQQLRESMKDKLRPEILALPNYHQTVEEDLDEIVTSTAMQVVEACEMILERHQKTYHPTPNDGSEYEHGAFVALDVAKAELQSLKQTKEHD